MASADAKIARLKLSYADGQEDEIAISSEAGALQIGEAKRQGRALLVRKGPQSNSVTMFDGSLPR